MNKTFLINTTEKCKPMNIYKLFLNIFWIFIFLIINVIANSQTEIRVGVKSGFNSAKQYTSPDPKFASTMPKVGFYIGVPIEIKFAKLFAFQIEPSYIQKGFIYSYVVGYNTSISFNYFELPLFLKLVKGEKVQFNIIAGPSAAVAVGGIYRPPFQSAQLISFPNRYYNRYDIGLNAGGGIKFSVGKKFMIIDMRYSYGLYDISIKNSTKILNKGFITTVGLLF